MNNIKIEVLGSGCASCGKMFELAKKAVAEMDIGVEVEYSTDIRKIIEMGVLQSPVLAVNGRPALTGYEPDLEKIKASINAQVSGFKPHGDQTLRSDKKPDCSCGGCC